MPRIPKSIKSTQQILRGTNHILHSLYAQSRELKEIEAVLMQFTAHEFAVSSFKNNDLTIITTSGSKATHIRYRQRNIISALKRAGLDVASIKIKVAPTLPDYSIPEVERTLSPETAEHLARTADFIEDEPLKKALLKLSRRTHQK